MIGPMVITAPKNNRSADREPWCLSWLSRRPSADEKKDEMDQSQTRYPSSLQRVCSSFWTNFCLLFLLLSFTGSTEAVFLNFDNCLEPAIINNPAQLQFVPLFFAATYDPGAGPNPLNITVYGNVTGVASGDTEPAPGSPEWDDPKSTAGKIADVITHGTNSTFTTLFTTLDLLSYTPYDEPVEFCKTVTQGDCPLGPIFHANA